MDNTLSSYMNQMAVDKDVWRKRWFVLTSRALICYESHHVSAWLVNYDVMAGNLYRKSENDDVIPKFGIPHAA